MAAHLPEVLVGKKGVVYWDWVGKPYCVAVKMDLINVHAPDGYVRIYWLKCEWLTIDTEFKMGEIAAREPSYSFAIIKDELAHFHATIGMQQDMINDLKDEVEDLKAMLKGVLGMSKKEEDRDTEFENFKLLSEEEQLAHFREDKDKYFTPEHKTDRPASVNRSPSGKYRLEISEYATSPGCWNFKRGEIYRVSDNALIADIKRNYSSINYLWVENHLDGHDYIFTGEDYQGQTVVQLDTGLMKTVIPPEAFLGIAFCWGGYKLISPNLLLIEGCYWACPYGYKVCDISNPMKGWPYLIDETGEDFYLDAYGNTTLSLIDEKLVYEEFWERHNLTSLTKQEIEHQEHMASLQQQKGKYKNDIALQEEAGKRLKELERISDDESNFIKEVHTRKTYNINGLQVVLIEDWTSDVRKAQLIEREVAMQKNKEEREKWTKNDLLLSHLKEQKIEFNCTVWSASALDRFVYEKPNPATIHVAINDTEIEWGVVEGPILVTKTKTEYPRTKEGMDVCLKALSTQAKTK